MEYRVMAGGLLTACGVLALSLSCATPAYISVFVEIIPQQEGALIHVDSATAVPDGPIGAVTLRPTSGAEAAETVVLAAWLSDASRGEFVRAFRSQVHTLGPRAQGVWTVKPTFEGLAEAIERASDVDALLVTLSVDEVRLAGVAHAAAESPPRASPSLQLRPRAVAEWITRRVVSQPSVAVARFPTNSSLTAIGCAVTPCGSGFCEYNLCVVGVHRAAK